MNFKMLNARTLKSPATLAGSGLHSGRHTTLRLCPAPGGSGIVFVRTDLSGRPQVSARQVDKDAPAFRTALKNGAAEVHTVEHLFSALAALSISDCIIEIDGLEVPGLDGSAKEFADAILAAGVAELGSGMIEPLVIKEPITIQDGIARITALPGEGKLSISYKLHYPEHPLAQGQFDFELEEGSFLRDIAPARTFAIKKDAEAMRAAGLGKGANFQNTVVIDGDKALETALRFPNEPVRHKILDLIGDLYVLGRPVYGRIEAMCSGHKTNRMLAMKILTAGVRGEG